MTATNVATNRSRIIAHLKKRVNIQDNNFWHRLQKLDVSCCDFETFYHEYDYNSETPGNGFRSLVKIIDMFFKKMHEDEILGNLTLYPELLNEYVIFSKTLCTCVKMGQIIRQKKVFDVEEQTDLDTEFFKHLCPETSEVLEPIFGHMGPFQYGKNTGKILSQGLLMIVANFQPFAKTMRMLVDFNYRKKGMAHKMLNTTVPMAKALIPGPIVSSLFSSFNTLAAKGLTCDYSRINIERNSGKYLLKIPDWKSPVRIEQTIEDRSVEPAIPCVYVKPKSGQNVNKCIIIHAHGGAFITNYPDPYIIPKAKLAKKTGVPVILPNYRKAPENKFPAPVQDFLDIYFFLLSGHDDVIKMIGFHPERIIVSGDSAGGHIVLSLAFALHMIRKEFGETGIKMPHAITLQYPAIIPSFMGLPSYFLGAVDVLITPGIGSLAFSMYAPLEPELKDDLWYTNHATHESVARLFSHRLKDPLFNLALFPDFHELKDIPLYITTGEMDPILDNSILLARKWAGKVNLSIVEGMPHAFTGFYMFPELADEISVYENQISQAVLV